MSKERNLPKEIKVEKGIYKPSEVDSEKIVLLGEEFNPQVIAHDVSSKAISFRDGIIKIDEKVLKEEKDRVENWLKDSIQNGDEKCLNVFLRNLVGEDEEVIYTREKLKESFDKKDPKIVGLKSLRIYLPTEGISIRNIIRRSLDGYIAKIPFTYYDERGNILSSEDDLDVVFARKENSQNFKLIVGSKRGVGSVGVPDETDMGEKMIVPDWSKINKKKKSSLLTIPLEKSKSSEDSDIDIDCVEIYLGPVDLLQTLEKQDEIRQTIEKEKRQRSSYSPSRQNPSSGHWSSYSG